MKKDPYLNLDEDMPNIRLGSDDVESFQRDRNTAAFQPPTAEAAQVKVKAGTSGGVIFILILLTALGSVAGWWFHQQNERQQQVIADSQYRISELERRLSSTDEEMGASTVELQTKVNELIEKTDELWKQMDSLWASAWRRNQSDIAALSKKVDAQSKASGDAIKKQVAQFEARLTQSKSGIEGLEHQIAFQSDSIKTLEEKLISIESTSLGRVQKISELQTKIAETQRQNRALDQRLTVLDKMVKDIKSTANKPTSSVVTQGLTVGQ